MKEDREDMDQEAPIKEVVEFHHSLHPPRNLSALIAKQLNKEGLLKPNNIIMKTERLFWVAATIAGIAVGFFVSTMTNQQNQLPAVDGNQYLLLLREDSTFSATEDEIPRLIQEYTDWAIAASNDGKLVGAEKLTNEAVNLGKEMTTTSVSGYFIITASSLNEATSFANTHPHLKYNGNIELRPVDKVR
jgi:hypothetical protein